MNIYEPAQYALSCRDEIRQYKAELRDESITQEAVEITQDWVRLHAFNNRHDLDCLIDDVILDWDQMGRPALLGHEEITPAVVDQAMSDLEEGQAYSAESYILCAAICEAMDSMVTSKIPETPGYERLFEAVKTVVEMEGADDEH